MSVYNSRLQSVTLSQGENFKKSHQLISQGDREVNMCAFLFACFFSAEAFYSYTI